MEAPPQSPPQSTPGSAVGTPLSVASSGWRSVEDAAARASAALTPELQHAPLEAPRTGPRGSPVRATHSNALFDDPDSSPAFGVKFGTEVSARPGAARGALFGAAWWCLLRSTRALARAQGTLHPSHALCDQNEAGRRGLGGGDAVGSAHARPAKLRSCVCPREEAQKRGLAAAQRGSRWPARVRRWRRGWQRVQPAPGERFALSPYSRARAAP